MKKTLLFAAIVLTIHFQLIASAGHEAKTVDSLFSQMKNTNDDSVKVYTLIRLSTEFGLNDLKKSVGYAENAVTIAENSSRLSLYMLSLIYCGNIYYNMGILDAAAHRFTQYDELATQSGDKLKMALSKINLSAVWLSLEDYEKAKNLNLDALQLLTEYASEHNSVSLSPRVINIYNNLSGIYREQKDFVTAMKYSDLGIDLARKTPNTYRIYDMLLDNRAKLLILQDNLGDALKAYEEVMELNKMENDKVGLAKTCIYLGEFYEKQGSDDKALSYYMQAYKLSIETNIVNTTLNSAEALYKLYEKSGKADSALKYVSIVKQYEQKINLQKAGEDLIINELTAGYEEREKTRKAEYKRKLMIPWMAAIVILLIAISAVLLYLFSWKKHRRAQLEKMNTELSSQKLSLEKELLQSELELKDKQLATGVLYKIQRNDMIENLVKQLLDRKGTFKQEDQEIIGDIIRDIGKAKEEAVWDEFELRFQKVHQDFHTNLSRNFPDLTPNERRLCTFLRLNMATKEISAITGQSVHSINVARTRLRKKLFLTNKDKGLIEFLGSL